MTSEWQPDPIWGWNCCPCCNYKSVSSLPVAAHVFRWFSLGPETPEKRLGKSQIWLWSLGQKKTNRCGNAIVFLGKWSTNPGIFKVDTGYQVPVVESPRGATVLYCSSAVADLPAFWTQLGPGASDFGLNSQGHDAMSIVWYTLDH